MPETGIRSPQIGAKRIVIWSCVALLGAAAWGMIALARDEEISAIWLVVAALGSDRKSVV